MHQAKKKVRSVVKIVRKEGKNKGKMFYSCGKPRKKGACDFFQWCSTRQSSNNSQNSNNSNSRLHSPGLSDLQEVTQMTRVLSEKLKGDPQKLSKMLRASGISFYANCSLVRRRPSKIQRHGILQNQLITSNVLIPQCAKEQIVQSRAICGS